MNIAIDGPSGAGKSTVAKIISQKLNIVYLDTGAMYRAIGLTVFRNGLSVTDEANIVKLLAKTKLNITNDNGVQKVFLDGHDVSQEIREHRVSAYASDVSKIQAVRLAMAWLQREIAGKNDAVLDGRDIGTFVLPKAEYKFFLTADIKERAKRRHAELQAKGADCHLAEIERDIAVRDHNDSTRDFAPLKKADDAIEIDSTYLTVSETVDKILSYIRK